MSLCGVNLRVEDVKQFTAVCTNANVDPTSIPILAILHDDDPNLLQLSYQAFAGLNVALWRCMSSNSQLPIRPADQGGLPHGAHIVGWNEADDQSAYPNLPGWVDAWWQQVRQQRPDLVIHYGAPNVDGYLVENTALEAALDVVDRHIGSTFTPPPQTIQGKPVWVTEVDIDPSRYSWGDPAAYAELVSCMGGCQAAGIPVFAWGIMPDRPDAAYDYDTIKAIAAMNKGETTVPDDSTAHQVLEQNALLAQAQYDILQILAKMPGVDAALLQDAKTNVNALNPSKFTF